MTKKLRIVFLDETSLGDDVTCSEFAALGSYQAYPSCRQEELLSFVQEAEVVITNKMKFNRSTLEKLPALRLICITATGYDNIDIAAANECGVQVRNVSGYSTESVVQHTFAMLFYLLEHLRFYDAYVRDGHYEKHNSFSYFANQFSEIHSKNYGIIGMGEIGRRVAQLAQGFGAHVAWASTRNHLRDEGYPQRSIQELCGWADMISIHAPLTPDSHDCISHKEFGCMKPHAVLINVGRGGIVNETALTAAIQEERIAGAGLDVLSAEPIRPDNPLQAVLQSDRLLVTPHMAWGSHEARSRLIHEVAENIRDFIAGGSRNIVQIQQDT